VLDPAEFAQDHPRRVRNCLCVPGITQSAATADRSPLTANLQSEI
jgi:hypothetical protein